MQKNRVEFSVFTKPWKQQSIDELGKYISGLGFDGIEFPLRPGYQVEPENAEKGLPQLVKQLGEYGLKVTSVAGSLEERVFAGCAAAGIPVVRIMAGNKARMSYMEFIESKKKEIDEAIPLCKKYGIKVGIQNHYGPGVHDSMELRQLIQDYDPNHVGAIWDAAHSGLAGEEPEQGLDIVWSHLCMVNLKNAFFNRINGPEAEKAEWKRYFTTGKNGLASWPRVSEYLKGRGFNGVVCLTAEYSDEDQVNRLITEDIAYAKSLFQW